MGNSATPSARGVGDSLSHFGGSITYADAESTSQFVLGDDERLEERDVDASVRALRPRSSRRGSWESEASRWSARVQLGAGTPSLARERSLRTNSVKTGVFSTENPETYDRSDDVDNGDEDEKDGASQSVHSPVTGVSIEPPSPAAGSEPALDPAPSTNTDTTGTSSRPDGGRKLSTDTVEPPNLAQETQRGEPEVKVSKERSSLQAGLGEREADIAAPTQEIQRERGVAAG
jgi:hypothetical protein